MLNIKTNVFPMKSIPAFYNLFIYPRLGFVFLSFFLIGGDYISFDVSGLTIRMGAIAIMAAAIFLCYRGLNYIVIDIYFISISIILLLFALISSYYSISTFRSVAYIVWMVFSFYLIVPLFYNFARHNSPNVVFNAWYLTFRLYVVFLFVHLIIIQMGLAGGMGGRPHFWLFEPSYYAIFMSPYIVSSAFLLSQNQKKYIFDFILASLAMALLASMTAIIIFLFALLIWFLFSRRKILFIFVSFVLISSCFLLLYYTAKDTVGFSITVGFILSLEYDSIFSIIEQFFLRSGNRVMRILMGLHAFSENPLVGIGIGADSVYNTITSLPDHVAQWDAPWISIRETPFINIFVEAAGTMGIGGLIGFSILIFYPAYRFFMLDRSIVFKNKIFVSSMFLGYIGMLFALQFEGTFLRFYLWSTFGLCLGMLARAQFHDVKNSDINEN